MKTLFNYWCKGCAWAVIVIAGSILFCFLVHGFTVAPVLVSSLIGGCVIGLSALCGFGLWLQGE